MSNPKFKMQKIKVAGGAFTFPLETSIVQKIVWKDLIEVSIYLSSFNTKSLTMALTNI